MNRIVESVSRLTALAVAFAAVLGASSMAKAEHTEDGYTYTGFTTGIGAGALFFEADEEFNSSLIVEGKVGYDLNDAWTLEGSFGYLPYMDATSDSSERASTWHLDESQGFRGAVDLLYHFDHDPGRHWDPTLGITGGVMYFSNSLEDGDHFDPFGGFGPGIGYALNRNWVARGDYRVVVAGHDTEINHHALLSLAYRWGRAADLSSAGSGEGDDELAGHRRNLRPIYFDFDKDDITSESKTRLEQNAEYLQKNPDLNVMIEGHCDERGTQEYNYALGERRANSTKEYLRALGVKPERMRTISYGEDRPADPGHNEEAWAKNRRAECAPQSR